MRAQRKHAQRKHAQRARDNLQGELALNEAPLPGSIMPMQDAEKMIPARKATAADDRDDKQTPHYADQGDHAHTIPI